MFLFLGTEGVDSYWPSARRVVRPPRPVTVRGEADWPTPRPERLLVHPPCGAASNVAEHSQENHRVFFLIKVAPERRRGQSARKIKRKPNPPESA